MRRWSAGIIAAKALGSGGRAVAYTFLCENANIQLITEIYKLIGSESRVRESRQFIVQIGQLLDFWRLRMSRLDPPPINSKPLTANIIVENGL